MIELFLAFALQTSTLPALRPATCTPRSEKARALHPRVVVPLAGADGQPYCLGIATTGEAAQLILYNGAGRVEEALPMTVTVALLVLQARHLEGLWAPLIDFAGPDLTRLRDLRLQNARADAAKSGKAQRQSPFDYQLEKSTMVRLRLADALNAAGHRQESMRLLENGIALAATADKTGFDANILRTRIASRRAAEGDVAGALAILDAAPATAGHYTNILINRAAILAEAGRREEALAALDAAETRLMAAPTKADRGGVIMPRAGQEFAWVRRCALKTQGGATAQISVRGALCSGDADILADALAAVIVLQIPTDPSLLLLQPGLRQHRPQNAATIRAAVARPDVAVAFARRMRVLPPEFIPALNDWRVPKE